MPQDRLIHPKAGHSQKVTSLTDFEHRVWIQYLLSADDFGVMRASAVTLQADNDALAEKSAKVVQRALDRVVAALLQTFEHQGRTYVFQHDWQDYQKIEWPRASNQPQPPHDGLARCTDATIQLFAKHPGGTAKRKPKEIPSDSGRASQILPEDLPSTSQIDPEDLPSTRQMTSEDSPLGSQVSRAGARAKRLTANANGSCSLEREFERKPSASSKWPIFKGNRIVVFEWMLTKLQGTLGSHADAMEWDLWFQDADRRAMAEPVVVADWWPWLQAELLIYARSQGWAVAEPQASGKPTLSARMASVIANIAAAEGR